MCGVAANLLLELLEFGLLLLLVLFYLLLCLAAGILDFLCPVYQPLARVVASDADYEQALAFCTIF